MKKVLILAVAAIMFAAPAFAADFGAGVAITAPNGEALSVLSNNVTAQIISDESAFAASTRHTNGTKTFASSSVSTKIFSNTAELTLSNSDTTDFADWDAL